MYISTWHVGVCSSKRDEKHAAWGGKEEKCLAFRAGSPFSAKIERISQTRAAVCMIFVTADLHNLRGVVVYVCRILFSALGLRKTEWEKFPTDDFPESFYRHKHLYKICQNNKNLYYFIYVKRKCCRLIERKNFANISNLTLLTHFVLCIFSY